MKNETQINKINRIFGLIFVILGFVFIYDSLIDFFKYNFTTVLFAFMRSNSSLIAEFTFGVLFAYSGIQLLRKNKIWINTLKTLAIGILINISFALSIRILTYEFDIELLGRIALGTTFSLGIYTLTKYLTRINNFEKSFKSQKLNLIIGILIGLFPFLFQNIYF